MAKWRIWYTEGRIYDSSNSVWEMLPCCGVLVVMLYFEDGTRRIMQGSGVYWKALDGTFGQSLDGDDGADEVPEGASGKRGGWADDYDVVAESALNDYRIPE